MAWISNFSLVMRSSLTALKEKVEDPERMLHQLIIDMEEELDRIRGSVAEAVADEIQMKKRTARERDTAALWKTRAEEAIGRSDDVKARAALEQKARSEELASRYATDHASQARDVEKLRRSVDDLEEKVRQARQKKTLLSAKIARAESTQRINQSMQKSTGRSAFAAFQKLEDKVDREEALTQAWDRMQGRDPDAEELAAQFERNERNDRVTAELEALKAAIQDD